MASAQPVVVLVGRPNVGKSTLFNRLSQKRRALTSPIPGTTRDWLEGTAHWGGKSFRVIDTGGYAPGEEDILSAVRAQVEHWVRTADAVLWVVDGPEGVTPQDQEFARWLRRLGRSVVVVVNKVDDARRETMATEFFRLGFSHVIPLSATHGRNTGALMDKLEEILSLPESGDSSAKDPLAEARVAVVGRPNVGKSSLANRLVGEERMIVSNQPGTTRDTVDLLMESDGKRFLFIDTAGLRAKKSKAVGLEGLTRIMSERALERCDVALLLLDATEGLLEGDTAVGRLIDQKNRACVVGINKWDAVGDKAHAAQWYRDHHSADMPFLAYSPIVFLSAKTGHNVPELLQQIWNVHQQFYRRFEKEELEAFFWNEIQNRPYSYHGHKLVFRSAEQAAAAPPTIVVRSNLQPKEVHFSYVRHLENAFRQRYGVSGVPLVFRFRR